MIVTIQKVLNAVELYQVIVSNSQCQFEKLPTIHQFLTSLTARKEVKLALLDLFSLANLENDVALAKFHTMIP